MREMRHEAQREREAQTKAFVLRSYLRFIAAGAGAG
jgi:hypothetical protein